MGKIKESLLFRWIIFWFLSPAFVMALANVSELLSGKSNFFSIHELGNTIKYFVTILLFTLPLFITGFLMNDFIKKYRVVSLLKRSIYITVIIGFILVTLLWISIFLIDVP